MAQSPDRKELQAQWKTEVQVPSMKVEDVSKHNSKKDNWIVIHGKVYNVSEYARDHPGGAEALYEVAGTDATSAYEDVGHSEDAREIMHPFLVGVLECAQDSAPKKTAQVHVVRRELSEEPAKSTMITTQMEFAGFAICSAMLVWSIRTTHLLPSSSSLHLSQGGFTLGFFCAGGVSAAVALLGYHQWSKVMSFDGSYTRFPPHMRASNAVARPHHPAGVLKPQDYQKFPLILKEKLSNDTARFVFKLPSATSILGLPIGQHVTIRGYFDDESGHHTVTRSYTPVSNNKDLGRLELVIKLYSDGQLTGKYLSKLSEGDEVEFRGPKGAMRYRKGMCKNLGMVAGGTGITPMYQLIRAICEDKNDQTQVHLLYGNKSPDDILLRKQLERYQNMAPEKFHLHMSVDKPVPGWTARVGYIDKNVMQETFAAPDQDTKILLCGPPGMINAAKKSLVELGYQAPGAVSRLTDQIFLF